MRSKLRNMLELWGDGGLLVLVRLVDGQELVGRVAEVDGDELMLEPIDDAGNALPLTVVMLHHVTTATYTDLRIEEAFPEEFGDESTDVAVGDAGSERDEGGEGCATA